ncbi:NAD(+) synthase, partial [Candidatus Marinamargulisbacteria bacterium SCGC AG-439-L15]
VEVFSLDAFSTESDEEQFQKEDDASSVCDGLCLGIKDYVRKSGFEKVVVALSGGIDSAVTVALAVRALGSDNVMGITMPSCYSSEGSVVDSQLLADNLKITCLTRPIDSIHDAYSDVFKEMFPNMASDLTEENIQARIRGNLVMAYANKHKCLVLATGNKSELAVGYCTLYGDMCGALSVLGDLYKGQVYALANFLNSDKGVIPDAILTKAPSAELKPNQLDQDSLPEYSILDQILKLAIEESHSESTIIDAGFDKKTVEWVFSAIRQNEYKRKQAPPVLKVSPKAFGVGRRFMMVGK